MKKLYFKTKYPGIKKAINWNTFGSKKHQIKDVITARTVVTNWYKRNPGKTSSGI
jgi:hypothetical protein